MRARSSIFSPALFGHAGEYIFKDAPWVHGNETDDKAGLLWVNGMTDPIVAIVAGVWHRLRLVMASPLYASWVDLLEAESEHGCSFRLLAKAYHRPARARRSV